MRPYVDLPPTQRQLQVLKFINDFTQSEGWPPTYREMMAKFGLASTGSLQGHIEALAGRQLVETKRGSYRAIRLTPAGIIALRSMGRRRAA